MGTDNQDYEGGCTCGFVRYRMSSTPMFVHCCHCRWCQRETGPDVHIFAAPKQPWVALPPNVPAVAEFYKASDPWPQESLERRARLQAANRPAHEQ